MFCKEFWTYVFALPLQLDHKHQIVGAIVMGWMCSLPTPQIHMLKHYFQENNMWKWGFK